MRLPRTRRRACALACALMALGLGACRGREQERAPERRASPESGVLDVPWLPGTVTHWRAEVERLARQHGLDPDLVAIVVLVESGGGPHARSGTGALGLMQILPLTGRYIAHERVLAGHSNERLLDSSYNLDFGSWYLARQAAAFAADDETRTVERAAAAYNGGPGRLGHYLRGDGTLSAETERYVGWVGGMWRERHEARSPTFVAWWQAGGWRLVRRAEADLGLGAAD
jgi:hypothetical protein